MGEGEEKVGVVKVCGEGRWEGGKACGEGRWEGGKVCGEGREGRWEGGKVCGEGREGRWEGGKVCGEGREERVGGGDHEIEGWSGDMSLYGYRLPIIVPPFIRVCPVLLPSLQVLR